MIAPKHAKQAGVLESQPRRGCYINVILVSHSPTKVPPGDDISSVTALNSIKHRHWISRRYLNLTVAITWETFRMKSARYILCSQTGLEGAVAADEEPQASRRIRRAAEGYATAIVRIIGESYGKDSVQNAWREFTIGSRNEFLGDDPNAELFFSWLFHHWSPDSKGFDKIDDESCYGVPPTRAYLTRHASELDPLRRRYLEACLAARFSFYEISDCKPHIGFRTRDVQAGDEAEVSEGMASTSLQNGDIVYAHIVSVDGTAMMEAISPISFPPTLKAELTTLCRHRKWVDRPDLPLRRLYFRLLESYCCLPIPRFTKVIRVPPAFNRRLN